MRSLLPFVAVSLCLDCGGAGQTSASTRAAPVPSTSASPSSSASASPASASSTSATSAGANPCEAKVPGIVLHSVGAWTPKWDDGAGCIWAKDGEFWGIHVRLYPGSLDTTTKLANMDDLKKAAPMMTDVGTAITKVVSPPKKTERGWYTVVESDEGKAENFVYVTELPSKKTLVCSAVVKSGSGMGGVTVADALAACDSIRPK